MLVSVFSINFLDFPESHCKGNGSFWSRPRQFDMGRFSWSRERALFHFGLILTLFSLNYVPELTGFINCKNTYHLWLL